MCKDISSSIIKHNEEVFTVDREKFGENYVAVMVRYPNCPHGLKIMVYTLDTYKKITTPRHVVLNPHFGDDLSPVARFEPTEFGWALAGTFVTTTTKKDS